MPRRPDARSAHMYTPYVYPIYIPARIFAGTSITFDYDTTDDDLRGDRGGFECHCGAANCRGMVLGSLYSPAPPTKAPSKAAA